jgi:hypothetical protein
VRIELRPSNQLGEIMANNGKFQPGQSGNPATQFKPGNRYRWRPGQSGNPAGVPRTRLQSKGSFNEALLGQLTAVEFVNLLCEAARERRPWAIQALQRLARQQINVRNDVRRKRTVLKNDPFVAAAEAPGTAGESIPTDRPATTAVEKPTRPRGTEEESSRQVSLKQRHEEYCLAKAEDHLRALPQAIRIQMFQETRSAIRRELPHLRGKELEEMTQRELISRIRTRLQLPSIEEFSAGVV